MGLNIVPDLYLYWKTDVLYYNEFIASNMSRNLFNDIKKYLHLSNPNSELEKTHQNYTPMQKINPIFEMML